MKKDHFIFALFTLTIVVFTIFIMLDAAILIGALVFSAIVVTLAANIAARNQTTIFESNQSAIEPHEKKWTIEDLRAYNRKLLNDQCPKYFDEHGNPE